jgi:hypothetical protein
MLASVQRSIALVIFSTFPAGFWSSWGTWMFLLFCLGNWIFTLKKQQYLDVPIREVGTVVEGVLCLFVCGMSTILAPSLLHSSWTRRQASGHKGTWNTILFAGFHFLIIVVFRGRWDLGCSCDSWVRSFTFFMNLYTCTLLTCQEYHDYTELNPQV